MYHQLSIVIHTESSNRLSLDELFRPAHVVEDKTTRNRIPSAEFNGLKCEHVNS